MSRVGFQGVKDVKECCPETFELCLVDVELGIDCLKVVFKQLIVLNLVNIVLQYAKSFISTQGIKIAQPNFDEIPIPQVKNNICVLIEDRIQLRQNGQPFLNCEVLGHISLPVYGLINKHDFKNLLTLHFDCVWIQFIIKLLEVLADEVYQHNLNFIEKTLCSFYFFVT